MSKIIKIFTPPLNGLNTNYEIIKWWESKRLFFNIANLVAFILGLVPILIFMPGLLNYFLLPFVIAYGFLINIGYLSIWVPLIAINKVWNGLAVTKIASVLLILVMFYSALICFFLCVALVVFNIP